MSSRLATWLKMSAVGIVVCVGGPAFTYWVSPTDEELFERYNPELQKKSLEGRYERQKAFDDYVTRLKEYSKSDRPVWVVQEEAARKYREDKLREDAALVEEKKARQEAMRKEAAAVQPAGSNGSTDGWLGWIWKKSGGS
ncbi:Assembly factor cbp4 [Diatrype stigma]|uniref:Cytochrome b mRNA-processing protein 4 n=1 Tax=Diatrype stigma TaxID=117547 RepID=A0AAN9UQ30_9PEZI